MCAYFEGLWPIAPGHQTLFYQAWTHTKMDPLMSKSWEETQKRAPLNHIHTHDLRPRHEHCRGYTKRVLQVSSQCTLHTSTDYFHNISFMQHEKPIVLSQRFLLLAVTHQQCYMLLQCHTDCRWAHPSLNIQNIHLFPRARIKFNLMSMSVFRLEVYMCSNLFEVGVN